MKQRLHGYCVGDFVGRKKLPQNVLHEAQHFLKNNERGGTLSQGYLKFLEFASNRILNDALKDTEESQLEEDPWKVGFYRNFVE